MPPHPAHHHGPGVSTTAPDGTTVNVNVMMPGYRPVGQLRINRGLLKLILLGMVTCGIYPLILFSSVSTDINIIAQRYDGRKTMHYILMILISPFTCGILAIVWYHKISERIGNELMRRGIAYNFGAGTYWIWFWLGSLLFGIGPLVYMHKMLTAMNLLSADYNVNG